MEHAVQQIMEKRAQRLVDVGSLPAGVAMTADQWGGAVQAGAFVAMSGIVMLTCNRL